MKPSQILTEARARIADPAHWTREHYARDAEGASVSPRSTQAVCWCVQGAIRSVADGGLFLDAHRYLKAALSSRYVYHTWMFNDEPDTKHEEVVALFDRAIALAVYAESLNPQPGAQP